jgi:hypothetical protein
MRNLPTYEQWNSALNEGVSTWIKSLFTKGADFAKSVWEGAKREKRETGEALRILQQIIKGKSVDDNQKKFLKAQSIDLVKLIPLIAIQGIPIPIPITPLLIMAGKKCGFDFLPNSHTKVNYQFESLEENQTSFSIRDKKPGDMVIVDGKELTITGFLTWVKNHEAKCISFTADHGGKELKVTYDNVKGSYVIDEFEGSYGGSTQMTSDLFLATQTAANGIAF